MSTIYQNGWKGKPAGYYAEIETKQQYEQNIRKEKRFNRLVEEELEKMGLDSETDIPTQSQIETAEDRAKERF